MSGKKLPSNWAWSRLGDLGAWSGGGTPSKANPAFWEDGSIPWVSPKDMKFGRIRSSENSITEEAVAQSSAKLIPANSILMVTRSGILAHSFPVAVNEPEVTVNQDLKTLTPADNISPDFLAWHLRSENYRILKECAKHGTTVASIDTHRLKNFSIPIAPLNEQHRIVEKIETLFGRIDKGEEALREVQKLLKRYRQSILKAAVTGELTRDWREANKHKLEPASDLLARILEARRQNWQGRGNYKEPSIPDETQLPKLPKEWTWSTVGALGDVKGGKRLPKGHAYSQFPTAHPYLRVVDFDNYGIDHANLKYLSANTAREIERYSISDSDTYISIAGTIGVVGVVPPELSGANLTENAAKICGLQEINPMFLAYWLDSPVGSAEIKKRTIATTQPKLALFRIADLPVPVVPLHEQQEIVDSIRKALDHTQVLEGWCRTELTRSTALRQSILKSAFTGQLVPQDPNDEPASELLTRIRAEREEVTKKRSKKKASRKKTRAKA